jgi:uncharacterized protein
MSQENVDRIRRGYEAFARRDLDAALEMMDPEIEAHDAPEVPDAAVHRGREAVRRDWEQMFDLFEDFTIDVEDLFDAGDELVVFLRPQRARPGKRRGGRRANGAHLREGRAIRLRQHLNRAAALEAAGLSEQGAHT